MACSSVLKTSITDYSLELPVCLLPTRGSHSGWIFFVASSFPLHFALESASLHSVFVPWEEARLKADKRKTEGLLTQCGSLLTEYLLKFTLVNEQDADDF